jgi:hypothetical protein
VHLTPLADATEELVEERLMIRVICFSLPLITVLYVFTNVSYLAVLPLDTVMQTETIGIDFIRATLPELEFFLLLCICVSTFGAAVGTMFTSR